MERDGLFVDGLLETLSRVRAAPAAESPPDVTTQALGEEGDQLDDDVEVTSDALGEEGDQADDQPFESAWGSSSAENDLYIDEPTDSYDDDVSFDTAI